MQWFNGRPTMVHPDHVTLKNASSALPLVEPVYPLTAGLGPMFGPITVAAAVLVSIEATRTPMAFTRFAGIPPIYTHVAALADPVLVEVPFPEPGAIQANGPYVLASTAHFKAMMNGYSGFTPASSMKSLHASTLESPSTRASNAGASIVSPLVKSWKSRPPSNTLPDSFRSGW